MDHIENLLVLQAMFQDIPDERIVPGLTDWQCGTAYCIGGWVARHPHFRALGVRAFSEIRSSWWGGAAPGIPLDNGDYLRPDSVGKLLFGEPSLFANTLADDTRAEINHRIEAALNRACDLS